MLLIPVGRRQQWRAQYSSFLKGTIWTTLNASMLTINPRGKSPSMVCRSHLTKFCRCGTLSYSFLHWNWHTIMGRMYILLFFACCMQTYSWMWRAAKMFMSLLTSMLKLRGLRVTTSTRLSNLGCRLGLLQKLFCIPVCTSISIRCFWSWYPKALNALNGVLSSTLCCAVAWENSSRFSFSSSQCCLIL